MKDTIISHDQIQPGNGICLDGQCYDATSLRTWLKHKELLPHNKARFTLIELDLLFDIAPRSWQAEDIIFSLASDAAGRVLGGLANGIVQVWSREKGKEVLRLQGHSAAIYSVQLSPGDGRRALTSSRDGSVRLWDMKTGVEMTRFSFAERDVWFTSAVFTSSGREVVAGGNDGRLWYWPLWKGGWAVRKHQVRDSILSVACRPKLQMQVLVGLENGTVSLFDLASGVLLLSIQAHQGKVYSVVFDNEGDRALTGSEDQTARIWDVTFWRELRCLRGHLNSVQSVSFSPDGTKVITGSADMTLRVWNSVTGLELNHLRSFGSFYPAAVFAADGRTAFTAIGSHLQVVNLSEPARTK